jgi:DNA helicase-2/ATP-dependent DNA helicase PcrA
MSHDLLADLTPPQKLAVQHGEGPLLILAGAGSGKTRVITRRVAYLLQSGVRQHNILAITFTNKAAKEMRHRVDALVPGHRVLVSTFHSLGARLLRQYSDRLNLDKNFTIYDTDDRNKLIKAAIEAAGIDSVKYTPERLGGAISKAKNNLVRPSHYAESAHDFFSQTVAKVYMAYEKRLRAANAMDFDDLLYLPALALKLHEEFRSELDDRFRYVMIDEYQDTNTAQYEFAKQLSRNHPNLCVVGDPDQNVYRWRGSDLRNILDFERDFPGARVIPLEQNFRSTQAVIEAANSVIKHNKQRKDKTLTTENVAGDPVRVLTFDNGLDEAEGVVVQIKQAVARGAYRYKDCAIFLRMNALTRSLESAFVKHGVPFQIVKGLAFFDRKENKDVLAYLRLIVNPNDPVSFLRVVNEPARGIGKVSLDKLVAFAAQHELTLTAACGQVHRIPEIRGKAATALKDFGRMMNELRTKLDHPPHEIIEAVLEQTGYRKMLIDSKDEDDADRLANIDEFITAAKQFSEQSESRTLGDFLEQITLASDVDSMNDESDVVSVMTLHAAKGLEFPVVYILAMEQGILPHNRSIESGKDDDLEEERRLCFVGMTRAMKELNLCHARMREFRGQMTYAVPSMFLDELPRDVERREDHSRNTARDTMDRWRSGISGTSNRGGYGTSQALPPVKPTIVPSSGNNYEQGQVVQHTEYGIGQILEVSGFGALRRLKVRFPAAGVKTFVADKAALKVVKRS